MLCERYWPTSALTDDANFDKKSDTHIEFFENGKLKGGHFDRSSRQYTNSVKETLRRTMLNQEAVFRNQVLELHRLYKIQQNLMNELSLKEFEKFTAWTKSPQATPISHQQATQYKRSLEENIFPISCSSMTVSTQTEARDMFGACEGLYSRLRKFQRRTFDLHLPADNYVSKEVVEGGNPQAFVNERLETKDFLPRKVVDNPEDLKLALISGKETTTTRGSMGTFSYKETCPYVPHVIDLEESTERISGVEAKAVSSIDFEASSIHTGILHEHGSHLSGMSGLIFLGRTRKDSDHESFLKHSLAENSGSRQERKSFDLNIRWKENDQSPAFDLFSQRDQSTSHEVTGAHLNRVPDNGQILHDSALMSPSPFPNSSGVSQDPTSELRTCSHTTAAGCKMASNRCSDGTHVNLQDNATHSMSMNSVDKSTDLLSNASRLSRCGSTHVSSQSTKFTENTRVHDLNEVVPIDLESLPERPPEPHMNSGREFPYDKSIYLPPSSPRKRTEENGNQSRGLLDGFLQNDTSRDASAVASGLKIEDNCMHLSFRITDMLQTRGNAECRQGNSEKSEEDTLSSRLPGSYAALEEKTARNCNTCKIKDSESVSENQHKVGCSTLSAFEDSENTQLKSVITGTSSDKQDTLNESGVGAYLSEKSSELKSQEHKEKAQQRGQAAETDIAMRRAAESLVHISLENKVSSLDCPASAGPEDLDTQLGSDQPQYSSESFESITLMLTESCMDEYSTTVKPFEEKELGDNASGLNLRRGRRLKDFQRDILPSLISLSRHEICEDMNIIGGVIRANECRKNGSRRVRANTWYMPTRTRRSRLYCSNNRY